MAVNIIHIIDIKRFLILYHKRAFNITDNFDPTYLKRRTSCETSTYKLKNMFLMLLNSVTMVRYQITDFGDKNFSDTIFGHQYHKDVTKMLVRGGAMVFKNINLTVSNKIKFIFS